MTNPITSHPGIHFSHADFQRLLHLRERKPARSAKLPRPDRGDRVADVVTATVGSWRFILIQSCLLSLWILLNVTAWVQHWDPYPFILLNLALSFQAAYATPFILMSQNRQAEVDRLKAQQDLDCDLKAEKGRSSCCTRSWTPTASTTEVAVWGDPAIAGVAGAGLGLS